MASSHETATGSELRRIERVMALGSVELFQFCSAEEVVRIAAISRPGRFAEDEVIYRPNEPADQMFCIVEGSVALRGRDGERREVGARHSFGVADILSGRLRSCEAIATRPVMVLQIDAEDLFDLLSNNVEIVKALFRKLFEQQRDGALAEMFW